MSFKCAIGIHSWDGCKCSKCSKTRDKEHTWDKCICSKCGKTRDEFHTWDGCKCLKCGKIRDKEHTWDECICSKCGSIRDEQHTWEGCKCLKCGSIRDEQHTWDGCKCFKCGSTRDEQHIWDGYKCTVCNKTRYIGEWSIVVKEFKNSKYPEYNNDPEMIGVMQQISIWSDGNNLKITKGPDLTFKKTSENKYHCVSKEPYSTDYEYFVIFTSNTTMKFIQIASDSDRRMTWTYIGTKII